MAIAYLPAGSFAPVLLVGVIQSAFLAPLAPIADAMALSASLPTTGKGFEYGWVRGGGSAAFVVGSLAAAALAALSLPNISVGAVSFGSEPARGFLALLHLRTFRRLLLVGALVLGSQALHDTFAVIRWRDAGMRTAAASLLWSEQVIAEVVVFLVVGPHLLHRLRPAKPAVLAAGAGVVRWSVLGATTAIVPLALVEPLHVLTFALFHLAIIRLIGTTVPRNLAATAQALYGTLAIWTSTAL